ncbi:hypothetical protein JCM11641_005841 [Rhodosporidiobolus odoratus]
MAAPKLSAEYQDKGLTSGEEFQIDIYHYFLILLPQEMQANPSRALSASAPHFTLLPLVQTWSYYGCYCQPGKCTRSECILSLSKSGLIGAEMVQKLETDFNVSEEARCRIEDEVFYGIGHTLGLPGAVSMESVQKTRRLEVARSKRGRKSIKGPEEGDFQELEEQFAGLSFA